MTRLSECKASTTDAVDVEIPTTSGALALANLQAQIDGRHRHAAAGGVAVGSRALLIELIALRGHVLGCIADYEWAVELAEQLTRDDRDDGAAFFARARARALFHRFTDALTDLDRAQQLGADSAVVGVERAAIFQAIGRYDEALTFFRGAAERRADFESLGALASLHAERREIAAAERFFDASRDRYRGVSPFPPALLDFQRGLMWFTQGDLKQARIWFGASYRRVPGYAPAQGHLAEVEAALGETETAFARLQPLTISSDDPDYAAALARLLKEADRSEEARGWCARAAARYDELIARHPEAFADHAAEFWLEAGADPHRALWLAQRNLEVRQTPRARELVARALLANEGASSERAASRTS
jgi:tetratricopeptide (TPR) repeat protein